MSIEQAEMRAKIGQFQQTGCFSPPRPPSYILPTTRLPTISPARGWGGVPETALCCLEQVNQNTVCGFLIFLGQYLETQ